MTPTAERERLILSAWRHSSAARACFFANVCRPDDTCECYRDAETRVRRQEVTAMLADLAFPKKTPRRRIDKAALAIPVVTRWRSEVHLDHVRAQRCCVPGCRVRPCEPHHLKQGPEPRGHIRASDCWSVPLCGGMGDGGHHRGADSPHNHGGEQRWAARHGLDLIAIATSLQRSSPVAGAIARHLRGNT